MPECWLAGTFRKIFATARMLGFFVECACQICMASTGWLLNSSKRNFIALNPFQSIGKKTSFWFPQAVASYADALLGSSRKQSVIA